MEAATKVLPAAGADRAIALPDAGGYLVAVADVVIDPIGIESPVVFAGQPRLGRCPVR